MVLTLEQKFCDSDACLKSFMTLTVFFHYNAANVENFQGIICHAMNPPLLLMSYFLAKSFWQLNAFACRKLEPEIGRFNIRNIFKSWFEANLSTF